jgi:hypothetical protein
MRVESGPARDGHSPAAREVVETEQETHQMTRLRIAALAVFAFAAATAPAKALCLFGCEPSEADARKVFENLVKKKFDPDAKLTDFKVDRFWRLDVEGAGHAGIEYYFTAKVEFPKGANLDCKPEGADNAVKAGCSASTYYSTTIQNKMVKERQYIEPGKTIEFKDETRFDQESGGWKGQDGNTY